MYKLFIRSIAEYCSVLYHSSITQAQSDKIETIQKTSLNVILADNYVSYEAALEMCNIQTLKARREKRCLDFALKCLKHPQNKLIFPVNDKKSSYNNVLRKTEPFKVNFASTQQYMNSTIPYCQRKLNQHFSKP